MSREKEFLGRHWYDICLQLAEEIDRLKEKIEEKNEKVSDSDNDKSIEHPIRYF